MDLHSTLCIDKSADLCARCWHTKREHSKDCQVDGCSGPCNQFTIEG